MSTLVNYQASYYKVTTSLKYMKENKEVIKSSRALSRCFSNEAFKEVQVG